MKNITKLIITTHYFEDDKEFMSDYTSIDIKDQDGNLLVEYGDYYHDKGQERSEAFIEAAEILLEKKIEIENRKIADWED